MDAYKQLLECVNWVLEHCTSYRVAKDLGINNRTINRYQNGTSPIENMSLETAGKIYSYYKEVTKMGEKVEVYENDEYLGEVDVSEIIEDYPFLMDEDFENVVLKISEWEIVFKVGHITGPAIVIWKRNTMTGSWSNRITFS